ncbi:MAG TPA: TRAP transporter large permease [Ramlibacter sp.]|nr:TRAP transporter large permease [Ramlibacter sp.]
MPSFILFSSFFLLLAMGMPIFAGLGLAGMATIAAAGLNMDAVSIAVQSALMKYNLLAVPMFVLTGAILERSGIAKRLLNLSAAIVGTGPGSLAVTVVVMAILMGGISGSAAAIAATIAGVMTSAMVRAGYPRPFIAAVVGSAASTDILVPPSVTLIVYSLFVPEASVADMFAAGLIPGTLAGIALIVPVYILARIYGFGTAQNEPRPPFWPSLRDASWGLLAKVVILGGLRIGLFTPTEAGVIAVCYSLFVGTVIYRQLSWRSLYRLLVDSAELTAVIMIIVSFAGVFSWALTTIGLIAPLVQWVTSLPIGPYGVLVMIIILLIVAGIFLDGFPIFMIFLPLLVPIGKAFGWDMVWFGVIMTFMIIIGMFTPPLSVNLMIAARIAGTSVEATTKWVSWLLLSMLATLGLIIVFPEIVLWLPRVLRS